MQYRNAEHKLLLQLIASLTLADHMGDVSNEVDKVLKELGMNELASVDWWDLGRELGKLGITTLWGTSLSD